MYDKDAAIASYNLKTAADADLNPFYRNPTTSEEHGGLFFHAALTLKDKLSAKGIPACGIVSIEKSNLFKEGHIELLIIIDTSSHTEDAAVSIAKTLKEYGFR